MSLKNSRVFLTILSYIAVAVPITHLLTRCRCTTTTSRYNDIGSSL